VTLSSNLLFVRRFNWSERCLGWLQGAMAVAAADGDGPGILYGWSSPDQSVGGGGGTRSQVLQPACDRLYVGKRAARRPHKAPGADASGADYTARARRSRS